MHFFIREDYISETRIAPSFPYVGGTEAKRNPTDAGHKVHQTSWPTVHFLSVTLFFFCQVFCHRWHTHTDPYVIFLFVERCFYSYLFIYFFLNNFFSCSKRDAFSTKQERAFPLVWLLAVLLLPILYYLLFRLIRHSEM